jgi:uncharacterized repeat protein (TIGR01451 family)
VQSATFTITLTPTPTFTVTPSRTRTITPTPTPTFTPTPTPRFQLTKTSNVITATIGDTVTFCLYWQNDSSSTVTMRLWDTISTFLTYGGCSNACSQSGSLVSWSFSANANTSGNVCFWGTVNGYPWWPDALDSMVAVRRPEPREDLFFALRP